MAILTMPTVRINIVACPGNFLMPLNIVEVDWMDSCFKGRRRCLAVAGATGKDVLLKPARHVFTRTLLRNHGIF